MTKSFTVKNKVWVWPGIGGWHFVYVDKTLSEKIKKIAKPHVYGSGFVRIEARIGKTTWKTALFPHTKEGVYLIAVKAAVRKKESIFAGDTVKIQFVLT